MSYLIFIPARAGSKGIKNKNLKFLKGKPLIFYTLRVANTISKKIKTDIFLSTDSIKIFNYCKKKSNIIDYIRPKYLAGDKSTIFEAIKHCIEFLKPTVNKYHSIILLQPTSPARKLKELHSAIKFYEKKKFGFFS